MPTTRPSSEPGRPPQGGGGAATQPGERRLLAWLLATVALTLAGALGSAFLRSPEGLEALADDGGATDLAVRAQGPGDRPGGTLVLPPKDEAGAGTDLGRLELEPGRRYLLSVRLGAGRGLALVARVPGEQVERWLIGRRGEERRYLRILDADELPSPVELAAFNPSGGPLEIRELVVRPLSPAHGRLRRACGLLLLLAPSAFLVRHGRRLRRALSHPSRVDDAIFALLLFAACLFLFQRAPVKQAIDARYMTVVSHAFLRSGEIYLPPGFVPSGSRYWLEEVGDRRVHFASPAAAVLDAPTVAVFEALGVSPVTAEGGFDRRAELRIQTFQAALLAAALCALLYLVARARDVPPLPALGWSAAFAVGTQILSTISRPYWTHAWAALLTAAALWLLLAAVRRGGAPALALAATSTAWIFYVRAPAVFSVIGLTAVAWLLHRGRRFWLFLGVGGGWAALLVLLSLRFYGLLLPPYMLATQVDKGRLDLARAGGYVYSNYLLGAWFSPGRGLFVFVPLFVGVLWLVAARWRRLPSRPLALVALAVFAAHTWLLVHTGTWLAGSAFGPRQFSDVVVWFFLLAVLASEARLADPRPPPRRRRAVGAVALAALLAASIFVNARGAFAPATWQWNSVRRVEGFGARYRPSWLGPAWAWNWRYPQFVAGLVPPPPPPGGEREE